jgi:hypothetical protein
MMYRKMCPEASLGHEVAPRAQAEYFQHTPSRRTLLDPHAGDSNRRAAFMERSYVAVAKAEFVPQHRCRQATTLQLESARGQPGLASL